MDTSNLGISEDMLKGESGTSSLFLILLALLGTCGSRDQSKDLLNEHRLRDVELKNAYLEGKISILERVIS